MAPRAATPHDRRRRITHRMLPLAALALLAFVAGVVKGAGHVSGEQRIAERFAAAWQRGDYTAMQATLSDGQRRTISVATLAQAYAIARETATVRRFDVGRPRRSSGGAYAIPVVAHTSAFGVVRGTVRLPIVGHGDGARVRWAINETFPGVPAGARLERHTVLPPRATLRARDNSVLARGPDRLSPQPEVSAEVVGALGPIPADEADAYRRAGYPSNAKVGISGLERIFERRLAGTPGGELRAGGRVLASARRAKAAPVRTTIVPPVQEAAVDRAGRAARRRRGYEARRPARSSPSRASASSGLQPPGSTFKIITATGALAGRPGHAGLDTIPVQTAATLEGVELQNANGESCGGTLCSAFAQSCNSVFAPLGAKARRAAGSSPTAERFGFNAPTGDPRRGDQHDPAGRRDRRRPRGRLAAIGQGRVQATALQMATSRRRSACAAAAPDARRWTPTAEAAPDARARRRARVAAQGRADDGRVVRLRHRRRAPRSRASGRGQDRDGRAEVDADLRRRSPTTRESLRRTRADRHRPTPTPGSRPTPRPAAARRGSRSGVLLVARRRGRRHRRARRPRWCWRLGAGSRVRRGPAPGSRRRVDGGRLVALGRT